ncbi:PEP-CTERM sorting domain-containing protein [Rhodoferax sp.]|uniref:PEP-CTERM sorting domain-containing protein n=2 Tax=Rhodoferax sp. TaxID=50421 RepID=UPI0025F72907|nr:PEP-CTERM sorting domain-containing protein [Rhodoferax sp.]
MPHVKFTCLSQTGLGIAFYQAIRQAIFQILLIEVVCRTSKSKLRNFVMKANPVILRLLGSLAVAAGLLTLSASAMANKVTNGGFETGDFSGWTQFGNTGFSGVQCPGIGVPEGQCDAFFGPVGSVGGIFQSFGTQIGAPIHVHFDFINDNGSPGSFLAEWISGSTTNLLSLTNPPGGGSGAYDYTVLAGAATSTIRFSFRDDPGFMMLDNVQVVPEPASLALVGLALAGLAASRRRKI